MSIKFKPKFHPNIQSNIIIEFLNENSKQSPYPSPAFQKISRPTILFSAKLQQT